MVKGSQTSKFVRKLYLCKCGRCYKKRDDFMKHLKQTKRWRKYHYATDFSEVPSTIWEHKYNNTQKEGK